jgi:two-component sensor histidine kinase/ligand-binding sensor domain-containing protein
MMQLLHRTSALSLLACFALSFVLASSTSALPTHEGVLFNRISTSEGISHTTVRKIIQDSHGFIWIGTQQGLNRFDGYQFEVFNHFPDDPQSLSNDWIYDIFEDGQGRIWVATDGGMDLYEPQSKTFRHYRHNPDDPKSLPHNSVRTIFQSKDGTLWVGTRRGLSRWDGENSFTHFITFPADEDNKSRPGVQSLAEGKDGRLWVGSQHRGLFILDQVTGRLQEFEFPPNKDNPDGEKNIRSILIDAAETVWVGTHGNGILRIQPGNGRVERLTSDGNPGSLSSNRIRKIYQDTQQRIWVATEGGGLNQWLPETETFRHYRHEPANPFSISDDVVYEIMEDAGRVIWLGTFNGISSWNSAVPRFTHVHDSDSAESSISNNKISSFAESADGSLWIGTIGGGVNRWDLANDSFDVFQHTPKDPDSLASNLVMSLLYDSEERLWAGTMSRGLSRMSADARTFVTYAHDPEDGSSISSNAVSNILQDRKGRIWVATYGGGLNRFLEGGKFKHYAISDGDAADSSANFLVDIEEALDGSLWLGSDGGGLIRFDPETEQSTVISHQAGEFDSISGDHIVSLQQTDSALWVGTRDSGLNRYAAGEWEHFTRKGGLVSNAIYGILEDESQRIWVSHGKGLSVYEPATGQFTDYTTIHGLQGNDFNNGAFLRTRNGKLLFGGANGFNIFKPSDIRGNSYIPPIKLTRFTKFNREFELDVPAHEIEHIELNYDDYVVGFEFAALDYTDSKKNQYRYMLAGFDKEWVVADGIRQASYTNLEAGEYIFRAQGSNNDGVWNDDGLAIGVSVAPPVWATWWAWLIYIVLLLLVMNMATRVYRARLQGIAQQRHNEQLAELVTERTSALQLEINDHKAARKKLSGSLQEKEVLLKEVHHRVKNNMQVISSLLNIQADSVVDEHYVNLLNESQQRIKSMALIHENLYRSDNLLEINFHDYIEMLSNSLLRFYRFEALTVNLELEVVDIFLDLDTAVPCGLIINELVSNSLKHAFAGRTGSGRITIRFFKMNGGADYYFSVADDGVGILEDVDIETSPSMGLEIVRILTQQLDGKLSLVRDGGSEFRIEFPRKTQ